MENEKRGGSFNDTPEFQIIGDEGLQCADCRFRLPNEGILVCHKYDMKPAEVLNGGECPKYKPE